MPSRLIDQACRYFSFVAVPFARLRRPGRRGSFLAVLALPFAVWLILLPQTRYRHTWIFSWDSAAYIETANSILGGRGLAHRVTFGLAPEIWQPLALWPPGFSLLLAKFQFLGLSDTDSCIVASSFAAAVALAAIGFICFRLLHWLLALLVVVTFAASQPFQAISVQCLSDGTYLALGAASIACLVQWALAFRPSLGLIFGAGLFAGAAWATRNAGLALFAATGIFLAIHLFWSTPRRVLELLAVWSIGVAVCSLPILVRNIFAFGRLNPYDMPPSDLSLWHNLRAAVAVIVHDLSASLVSIDSGRGRFLLAFAAVAVAIFAAWRMYGAAPTPLPALLQRNKLRILLASYALIYTALVIVARTKYKWGDVIDSRYMVQIYWVLLACAASGVLVVAKRWAPNRALARNAVAGLLLVAAVVHLAGQLRSYGASVNRTHAIEGRFGLPICDYLQQELRPEEIVLAVRADLLRVHCDVNARAMPHVAHSNSYRTALTADAIDAAGEAGHLWGVVIDDLDAAREGKLGALVQELATRPDAHKKWERIALDSPALVLKYID